MKVSVVILVLNGGETLRASVESLLAQKPAQHLEVLLLDSGSTDGSAELGKEFGVRVERISQAEFRFGYARNLAFRLASGDLIATISQDYIPADDRWLDRLTAPLRSGADVTLGRGMPYPGRLPFFWETRRFAYTREGRAFIKRYGGHGFSCMCLATRRAVWQATGFGDEMAFSEDKFFQRKCFEQGFTRVQYVPQAAGYHGHRYTLRSLIVRCQNEGLGWRAVGERYSLGAMLLDLVDPPTYAKLVLGLAGFRIRSLGELLFPLVRPLAVFWGNRFNRELVR